MSEDNVCIICNDESYSTTFANYGEQIVKTKPDQEILELEGFLINLNKYYYIILYNYVYTNF